MPWLIVLFDMVYPTVSQVDPHRDRNSPEQHDVRATRESVLSFSQNKPPNIYKVMADASFTIFRSLVRAAVDYIIFSLMLHGFEA